LAAATLFAAALYFSLVGVFVCEREKTRANNGEIAFSLPVSSRGQVQVRPIDKLDEACTNADDRMMLAQLRSGDRVMS